MTDAHTHQDVEDRITAEMSLVRTEVATLRGDLGARIDGLRDETRRGFTDVTQVLGQILARLPERPADTGGPSTSRAPDAQHPGHSGRSTATSPTSPRPSPMRQGDRHG